MSEIKMSERFGSVPNFDIKEFFEDDQLFAIPNVQSCYDDISKAVNNHDRLVEENAELRSNQEELLKAVKFLFSKSNNLNELQSKNISSMIEYNNKLLNK